jgi:type IV pilus assembly protein PilM
MSDSIWKKEIHLRPRKPEPDDAGEKRESFWTKEISLGRRQKRKMELEQLAQDALKQVEGNPDPDAWYAGPEGPPEPIVILDPPQPSSIWKKEISLGRSPLRKAEPEIITVEPTSIWKKEISFRRAPKPASEESAAEVEPPVPVEPATAPVPRVVIPVEAPPAPPVPVPVLVEPVPAEPAPVDPAPDAEEPAPAAEQPKPFWKREIAWRRQPKPEPEPEPEPEVDLSVIPVAPSDSMPFWKKDLSLRRASKRPPADDTEAPAAKPERAKRQLRLPKLALPKSSGRRGGHPVKRLVGLKVGASQLAAARVANNGAAELLQVARQPLEHGVVVGGEVRDPEALAAALKTFFARHKLPRKNVRLGIASNRIGVRIFDVEGIDDEKQLENAIRFRAQEALPIPLDEAVLDYHLLGESVDDEGKTSQRVLLVVAYRELVDRYVSACRKAGLSLVGIDLEAFALLRSLAAPRADDGATDSALVAVAIGHDRSTFAVSDGRICEFTRVIEWGGSTLSVAIARALDVAPSEVEALKRLVSLDTTDVPEGVAPEQYALAVDAVRKQVQAFARELVSSLQFYQHQPGSLGIGEIVITGGTASLAGLADELQRMIGVGVRVGDPLARLRVPKKLPVDQQVGSLAIAIGLGIED